MNRRDIMKLFGLGAAAAATPVMVAAPVAAGPVEHPLFKQFTAPLFALVEMRGGKVYNVRATRHPDRTTCKLSLHAYFSGCVNRIAIHREGVGELIRLGAGDMTTPFIVSGSTVDIEVVVHNP